MRGRGNLSRYSDSLRAGRSADRIPVGARFSALVQTGPAAHPTSCTMGTGSFPGVKRTGRGPDHPPTSKRRGHERVELYLYSPSGPSWPVIGRTFTFTYTIYDDCRFVDTVKRRTLADLVTNSPVPQRTVASLAFYRRILS